MCLCVEIVFPILCMVMCDCLPCHFFPLSPALAELQQAGLITSEECGGLHNPSRVVGVQRGKSPEMLIKTADVLRRHGLKEQSNLLAGKQTQSLIHVMFCTVEPSCKGHLKVCPLLLSFTYKILSHSEHHICTALPLGHLKHLLAHTKPFPWVDVCQQ